MKKIFTLIAVAAMAISANAQGTYALQGEKDVTGPAIAAGTKITSVENMIMTFGDGGADFKGAKYDSKLKDLLGATGFTEGNGTNGNKENGTIYYFEPAKDGVLTVGVVVNADKTIIVKKDNYSGEDVAFKMMQSDGTTEVTVTDGTIAAKTYGAIILDVNAGNKYAIGLAGSKMGFYGFKYELSGSSTAINTVKAAEAAADGAAYNLAGQKVNAGYKGLVIKNGKKVIVK